MNARGTFARAALLATALTTEFHSVVEQFSRDAKSALASAGLTTSGKDPDPAPKGERIMRWPAASTIRAAAAALAAGDTLALSSRHLRYVSEFFGLALLPRPAGVTPRQWAARQNWVRRRESFGPSGFSETGEHSLRLNLVQARIVKRRRPKSRHCRRGHLWTPANTRLTQKGRSCRACEQIIRAQRARRRQVARQMETRVAELRQRMIDVGVRAHQDPSSAYWRQRFVAIRERWQEMRDACRANLAGTDPVFSC